MKKAELPFWQTKSLTEMTESEWESVCDGCGRCCLHKLEDVDTGEIFYTRVACRLLDEFTARCRDYDNRLSKVPDCLNLTADKISEFNWLPSTCAYRLLAENKPLPNWHPLVSGDGDSVHRANISIVGKTVSEELVQKNDLSHHIITWID